MSKTNGKKPAKKPAGLVALALSLSTYEEGEPLKAFAASVVAACDVPAADMRRAVFLAVEKLRDDHP